MITVLLKSSHHLLFLQHSPSTPDPTLSPSPATFSPSPNSTLSYLNSTYRILKKPLTWQEAVLLCESLNASLVNVMEPYTQAFFTQVVSPVRSPLWIGLSNEEVRLP